MKNLPDKVFKPGPWVQTERKAHESWAQLIGRSPLAAQIMHLFASRVGEHNAVVVSQKTLASLLGASRRGVQNAVGLLEAYNWVEVWRIGGSGSVNAYVLNERVVWSGKSEGRRYALFSAAVIASEDEQIEPIDGLEPLMQLPRIYPGERQLPAGDGLPPPSQPSLDGLEPDLPATGQIDIEDAIKGREDPSEGR